MFKTGRCLLLSLLARPRPWGTHASRGPRALRWYSQTGPSSVTKIEKLLLDSIKATGPVPFSTYMQMCLSHPTHGYYMNPSNPVFGSRGDFITSPEISQVFGELVGIWLLSQWMSTVPRPPAIRLVELGPGRGTLMEDILRVISQLTTKLHVQMQIHLVETSLSMRELQKEKLQAISQQHHCEIHWHDTINDIPPSSGEYTMLVAHEFFDALPIHVVQKTEQGWHEVLIANNPEPSLDVDTTTSDAPPKASPQPPIATSRFRQVLSPTPSAASMLLGLSSSRFKELPVGARIEVSPASFRIARQIGELLAAPRLSSGADTAAGAVGGCALIVDYGGDKAFGDSFRAFKGHKIVDIFDRPGECDLTANVDFAYLKEAMADLASPHGPLPQAAFLERMGLQMRVDALVRAAKTDERKKAISSAAARLVDSTGMGREYQVMGITSFGAGAQVEEVWPFVEVKAKEQ